MVTVTLYLSPSWIHARKMNKDNKLTPFKMRLHSLHPLWFQVSGLFCQNLSFENKMIMLQSLDTWSTRKTTLQQQVLHLLLPHNDQFTLPFKFTESFYMSRSNLTLPMRGAQRFDTYCKGSQSNKKLTLVSIAREQDWPWKQRMYHEIMLSKSAYDFIGSLSHAWNCLWDHIHPIEFIQSESKRQ